MTGKRVRGFFIPFLLIVCGVLVGSGLASYGMNAVGENENDKVRALSLLDEVNALDKHLEKRMQDLGEGIRDAVDQGNDANAYRLVRRQQLIQESLVDSGRFAGQSALVNEAEEHLRGNDISRSMDALTEARVGYYRLLDDISAAEFVLETREAVEDLRQLWLMRNMDSESSLAEEAERGFVVATEAFEVGEFADALHAYRLLMSDYQSLLASEE